MASDIPSTISIMDLALRLEGFCDNFAEQVDLAEQLAYSERKSLHKLLLEATDISADCGMLADGEPMLDQVEEADD